MSQSNFTLAGLGMTLQKPIDLEEPAKNEQGYNLTELDSDHWMHKEIVIDFNNAGMKVLKVERLENHLLWQKYSNERTEIEQRIPKDPAFVVNEKYLYHGTTAKKDFICTEGLDARLSNKGCFGRGIYFSDFPKKCVKYAEKGKNESLILLERVILGSIKMYPNGGKDPKLRREPKKEIPFVGWRYYDSVKGRPRDHTEYVVYSNDRALIECIITYSKAKDDASSSTTLGVTNSSSPLIPSKPDDASTTLGANLSSSLVIPSQSDVTIPSHVDDDSDATSDEDDGSSVSLSDTDQTEGYSSDSSLESDADRPEGRELSEEKTIVNPTPIMNKISGEDVLNGKEREFRRMTGEIREHVIESYLSAAGLDVTKAVQLFNGKDKKKQKMEEKQMKNMMEAEEEDEEAVERENDGATANFNPATDPERWKHSSEEDKLAIIELLTENFLTITNLEDDDYNRKLSKQVLSSCDYNLELSIVAYYESL